MLPQKTVVHVCAYATKVVSLTVDAADVGVHRSLMQNAVSNVLLLWTRSRNDEEDASLSYLVKI
jgi:hypothetical protein